MPNLCSEKFIRGLVRSIFQKTMILGIDYAIESAYASAAVAFNSEEDKAIALDEIKCIEEGLRK